MRVYKVTWLTPHIGSHIQWATSKKECAGIIKQAKKDCDEYIGEKDSSHGYDILPIDISMNKKGIIEFLKAYTPDLDNG